jgi:zinc-binding alcohol dehydrogenase/oxidoreductase
MKAAVLHTLNTPLEIRQMPIPIVKEGEHLVQLAFAGLNHRDVWISKGQYAGIVLPLILGSDGSGILDGKRVIFNPSMNWGGQPEVQASDYRILGLPDQGTLAQSIVMPNDKIHTLPEHLSLEEGAAIPLAGLTAYRALVTKCHPKAGEKVLISGIGGGVALFAMQFALALGCEVYVTSGSDEKIEKAIALGAKGGANYSHSDFSKEIKRLSGGVDVIIDSAAGDGFAQLAKVCNPAGRICFYGGTRGAINGLVPQWVFWKQLSIYGSTMGTDAEFEAMLRLVADHQIRPVIDQVFPLEAVNEAFERMDYGLQFGKILVDVR